MTDESPRRRGKYADLIRTYPKEERKLRRQELREQLLREDGERVRSQGSRHERGRRRRRRRERLLYALAWCLRVIPTSVAARLGEALGWTVYRLSAKYRGAVMSELRTAYGDEKTEAELASIAKATFQLTGRGAFSLPSMARRGAEGVLRDVEVVDEHRMEEALAGGRGALVTAFHYGLFEAGGVWLANRWNGKVIGREQRELGATRMLIAMREELGVPTIQRGEAREIVRTLRANRPVALLADQDVARVRGVFVPFFGRLAHTPIGPAALSVRTGAPVVATVVEWVGRTRHRVRVLSVLRPREDLDRDEAVHELTYRITKLGEDAIRARPEHWLWFHKRWQTRPEDRPELPVWEPPTDA